MNECVVNGAVWCKIHVHVMFPRYSNGTVTLLWTLLYNGTVPVGGMFPDNYVMRTELLML